MFFLAIFLAIILVIVTVFIINYSYTHAIKNAQAQILASLNESAIVIDTKQKILLFNAKAETMTGIAAKDALGKPIDEVLKFSNGDTPVPYSVYGESNNTPESKLTLLKGNGEKYQVALKLTPDAFGTKGRTLLTLLDTSQEKQLEEMKVDFVSMAAHELRTPLTAIRGYASLLQMHYSANLDDSAKELLTRLIVSTTNLASLIDNLLSISRIERNDLTVEVKPLDLSIIVKDIYSSFKQDALTRKQTFTLNMPDNLPMVMADPFRIGQVFINLIGNAIKYTPNNGTVTVTLADRKDHLEIAVQDTGEGIPKEALPRLFTKFFRVSGSLEQGSKGSGVGLFITKSIVEMHKGKIWADSQQGKGSIFTFTLPVATEAQKNQQQQTTNGFLTVKNGQGIIVRNNPTNSTVN
ncbi:MAG TPA: ATP-binding protein [Candidatus Saccharimonadales bacterium]|nr:ATP-binding protein [Candidatus Saccharimonadales bacterium]